MMEYELLARVGLGIGLVVKGGYALAASYFVRVGFKYVTDYKESVANDKGVS